MKIVFVGNCHTFSIKGLVQRALEDPELDLDFFWREDREQDIPTFIRGADRVVYHVTDYQQEDPIQAALDEVADRAIRLPYIAGNFLWPFSTQAHPRNAEEISYFLGSGPYEPQFGDAQLIKMMQAHAGEPAEDIVDRFLELDFNSVQPLDRYYEFNRHKYQRLGQSCSLDLWSLVERYLIDHRPFYTCYHPSDLLMKAVGRFALEQFDVPSRQIARLVDGFDPFISGQMPIHPSVIRHFGLRGVDENTRYLYFPEGSFTAREYYIRFINFTYDRALHQAVYDFGASGRAAEVVPLLIDRLKRQADNPDLWHQLACAQHRLGKSAEAARCVLRALALEPGRRNFQNSFRHMVEPTRLYGAWPKLPLGEIFSFAAAGSPALHGLRSGWSHPEPWGVWGLGGELRLTYPLEDIGDARSDESVSVVIECWPAVHGPDHRILVDVLAEDRLVAHWIFDEEATRQARVVRQIDACPVVRVNGDPILALQFRVTGFSSPAALGLSGDQRPLSLGLKSISVSVTAVIAKDRNDELDRDTDPSPDRKLLSATG
jgi:tetratricopeptide (TPR) repeat protein